MSELKLFGLVFQGLTLDRVLSRDAGCKLIVTVNADFIVRANEGDHRLAGIINRHTSTFDGMWPFTVAKRKFSAVTIEKLSGSTLIYNLADACAASESRLLIVGGTPESSAAAQENLNRKYQRDVCRAWSPPYESYPYSDSLVCAFRSLIEEVRPLAVAFCLGSPAQEYFAEDQLAFMSAHGVAYCIGAGGTVDFLSGKLKRAPRLIQVIGLEGLWRLLAQPSVFRIQRLLRSVRMFRYI